MWISKSIDKGLKEQEGQRLSHDIGSNSNMASSSDSMEIEYHCKFKELNAENLKNLCCALEEKVPWQKDIIPEIASTILQCRSGMMRRKDQKMRLTRTKEETWLFFEGGDVEGKDKIARELASLVYGSYNNFLSIGFSTFSSARSDSTDDLRNKRSRSEAISDSYLKRFIEAIHDNPHRVIIMEDIDQVDYHSQLGIGTAIERGRVQNYKGEEISIGDAIIIFSCESSSFQARSCSPAIKQKLNGLEEKEEVDDKDTGPNISLDLNLCAVDNHEDCSFDALGLLESVDRMFFFKLPEEL